MTWFYCDHCCDTVKKPKVAAHARRCHGGTFTCIDCSETFDLAHTVCVTEKEKYVEGATKPRGSQIFDAGPGHDKQPVEVVGCEHLAVSAPWRCMLCKVNCTSKSTMLAHATGQKHRRKSRAFATAATELSDIAKMPDQNAGTISVDARPTEDAQTSPIVTDQLLEQQSMAKHAETHAPQTPKRKQAKHKQEVAKSVASQSQTCCPDDVRDHYLPEKQKQENGSLQEGPANVAPVVRKLIKKHGGTMRLHKLIGVISKKKKLRLGLTGDESMTQILEAVFKGTGNGYDVLVVQRQAE